MSLYICEKIQKYSAEKEELPAFKEQQTLIYSYQYRSRWAIPVFVQYL